jgi:hypothetical protein
MAEVQRICVRAKPTKENADYFEWQAASICMFVPEEDKELAVRKAREELKRRHWDFIKFESKSTLIESRVREAGGEVWEAYEKALKGELSFIVFSDAFGAGNKSNKPILPARISEEFIDRVVKDAGGTRLPTQQGAKSADYLLGSYVFELKDLQEEVLGKKNHQKRLAELFRKYFPDRLEIAIDPSILTKSDYQEYVNIIGRPIKTQIRSASKQVKASKNSLNRSGLRGGIIFMNTGIGSLPHEVFAAQVARYANKDSGEFDAVVSISIWNATNGFDTYVLHAFSPKDSVYHEVRSLKISFDRCFEEMMTDLVRGRIPSTVERAVPRKSLTFSVDGVDYAWIDPTIPWSMNNNRPDDDPDDGQGVRSKDGC